MSILLANLATGWDINIRIADMLAQCGGGGGGGAYEPT